MSSKSIVYHFSARGSHFRDDDITKTSKRQQKSEMDNSQKFYSKWGSMPVSDEDTFVKPIRGTNNPNRISLL
jgi:hypothetical protein